MNRKVRKLLALALALIVSLGSVGITAADGVSTPSDLPPMPTEAPAASAEPTTVPEATEAPIVEAEPTAVPEATEAPTEEAEPTAVPEATEAPTEEAEPTAVPEASEAPIVEAEPTATPEPTEAPAEPETVDVLATIVWEDNSDAKGIRPDSVTAYAIGSEESRYTEIAKDRPLPGESGNVRHDVWTQEFRGLPKMSGDAVIEYRVSVRVPEGYRLQIDGMTIHLFLNETEAPVEETKAPEVTEAPVEETEAPEVTETPEVTEAPVEETEASEVTETPEVTEVPVEETEVPEVTETPVPQETEMPAAEATEAPAVTEAPAEPTKVASEEKPEPIEKPIEKPAVITYERDEHGNLVLDENGMPVPNVPEGMDIPVEYKRDETGALVLDESGNPIPTQTVPAGSQKQQTLEDLLDPNRRIDVYAKWEGDTLRFGDEMTLTAVLHGYDNATYTLQWQVSADANTWTNIDGETEAGMTVLVTEENYLNYWRVAVIITDATAADVE